MYEYIQGTITELTPTYAIVDNQGLGYFINISVTSFSALTPGKQVKLYLHQVIREDAHLLFGFVELHEREIFRLLLSVSGIGANTARMILSSLSPSDLIAAIASGNLNMLKGIKGIGAKTAERMLVDLRDKVGKMSGNEDLTIPANNTARTEALSALVTLGFSRPAIEKVLTRIAREEPDSGVEDLIRKALKLL
jgi:holliday junction DNA helicase RuvA